MVRSAATPRVSNHEARWMRDYDLTQPKCPGFAGENGKAGRQRRAFIRQRGYARIRDHSWGTTGEDNPVKRHGTVLSTPHIFERSNTSKKSRARKSPA